MPKPFKLLLVNRSILVGSIGLVFVTGAFGHAESNTPVPIWPGEENVPKLYGGRKVFLSHDERSVVILWPTQNGAEAKPIKMLLHNAIDPNLRVQIEKDSDAFIYAYDLENSNKSDDSITTFSIVVHPDSDLEVRAELWTGGKSTAIVGNQVALPGARPGGLAIWFCPDGQPLAPGKSTKFRLTTRARPGFTTAATEHFPHLDLTDQWPQQILDELNPVLDPSWIDQHLITLGPRYGPEDPATIVAQDYVAGINELSRKGLVNQNSAFVAELMAVLERISRGESSFSALSSVRSKPQSPMEVEIFNGIRLSLGIEDELR